MMKFPRVILLTTTVLCQTTIPAAGQETERKPEAITFCMDCSHCNFNIVRQELPFISLTRDPLLADVRILVTESATGSGGYKFFMNFIGRNQFKGTDYEYTATKTESDTDDGIRKALLQF